MLLLRWAIKMGVVLIKWARPKIFAHALRALVIQPHHSKIPGSAPACYTILSSTNGAARCRMNSGIIVAAQASSCETEVGGGVIADFHELDA